MSEPDGDRPESSATADVALITRAVTVAASVESAGSEVLVVRPEGLVSGLTVGPGDLVEVYWAGTDEERSLPARIAEVESNGSPLWRLTVTGPSTRSRRRKAVRAAAVLPVTIPWAGGQLTGVTEDLSEAGLRARLDGWGLPPEPGTELGLGISLTADDLVTARGRVVRLQDHGGTWTVSVEFVDLPERDADRVRRSVFGALREQRAAETADD
ncbi:PilZ domain-containing protein [Blastococcus sp. URHD0036]|uniref:PilZ domain-containing protein n=1 Tax=Blastococcus sp. URHD0036 TaxID=1380356 RepID=UPI000496725F|nr:PilZ domain-containing protein [Blastococcus sp. URHD0036]